MSWLLRPPQVLSTQAGDYRVAFTIKGKPVFIPRRDFLFMILLINTHLMTPFSVGIFDEEHRKNKETIFWLHTEGHLGPHCILRTAKGVFKFYWERALESWYVRESGIV